MALNKLAGGVVAHNGFGWSALSNLFQQLVNDLTLAGARIAEQQQSFVLLSTRHSQHIGARFKTNQPPQPAIIVTSVNIGSDTVAVRFLMLTRILLRR